MRDSKKEEPELNFGLWAKEDEKKAAWRRIQ
jgi:hypothetical protein